MIGTQGSLWVHLEKQLRHFSAYQPIYRVDDVCSGGVPTLCNVPLPPVDDQKVDGFLSAPARTKRGSSLLHVYPALVDDIFTILLHRTPSRMYRDS